MKLTTWFFLSFLYSTQLMASDRDHKMTRILGEGINLAFHDHGISGSVNDLLVFGSQFTERFGSQVTYRHKRGVEQQVTFEKVGEMFQGTFTGTPPTGEALRIKMVLNRVDHKHQQIHLTVNSEPVVVTIESPEKQGHHFINPTYTLEFQGKTLSFGIEDGAACYGCSINLVFMILGGHILSSHQNPSPGLLSL